MSRPDARYWIDRFDMITHIEGGSFAEVYKSPLLLPQDVLPGFQGPRPSATHIFFLLEQGQFSAFHRITADELWHFYEGDPMIVYEIKPGGQLLEHRLGKVSNASPFTVISGGSWFASAPEPGSEYSLVGCTVSPGFDFADFELARKEALASQYPEHAGIINRLGKD